MKFVMFVEGHTEKKSLPQFLKRWLDPRLTQNVGIKIVRFDGWAELVKDAQNKANRYLNGPDSADIIAVIGLIDLYGPTIYPENMSTAAARYVWAKQKIETDVGNAKFKQFFAVHECEAWLLSHPDLFPDAVKKSLSKKCTHPETVNNTLPPKALLKKLYWERMHSSYKEVTYGKELFSELDPNVAYSKCPRLREMLDEMVALAVKAGINKVVMA